MSARRCWHAVSLVVPAGQVTVLTGLSGAGKTTIADLILGLHQPDQGQVLLDDVPLREIDLASWRSLVGYVPQELVLFHDSIFANVALGDRRIGEAEVRQALEMAGAWDFVRRLPEGMKTHVGESGAKLSGGERQRIALARALVARPRLLILDEVTSALDPDTEWQICRGIRELAGEMAVLAITHRPAFLEIADLIYRIEAGRAIEASAVPRVVMLDGSTRRERCGCDLDARLCGPAGYTGTLPVVAERAASRVLAAQTAQDGAGELKQRSVERRVMGVAA